MQRRTYLTGGVALGSAAVLAACGEQTSAQVAPSSTVTPTPPAYIVRVQMRPPEARLGQDQEVVIQATFATRAGRGTPGAQLSAIVNYPTGPKTFTQEITTFPDGRVDLAVPVAPATTGTVRVEVVAKYQGQEYRTNSSFNVRA